MVDVSLIFDQSSRMRFDRLNRRWLYHYSFIILYARKQSYTHFFQYKRIFWKERITQVDRWE